MDVVLGFPFRGVGERESIFSKVRPLVESMYPFSNVLVADSGHETFNRAATRNVIADWAIREQASVVVICDADSIPQEEVLRETIEMVYEDGQVRIPFDEVRVLPSNRFLRHPNRFEGIVPRLTYGPSCGGIYVLRPSLWRSLGGMDERIDGWGFEDRIFLCAINTFSEGPIFHVGNLYTVDHSRDIHNLKHPENNVLMDRYLAAEGNPSEFKLVSLGSNRFCTD
jgi:predicted glycosyltransferase involved in capsule biosynthesis